MEDGMKYMLLWAVGVPMSVLVLMFLFGIGR
jgi:hypothetical protein